jgi:hypothetical protein
MHAAGIRDARAKMAPPQSCAQDLPTDSPP